MRRPMLRQSAARATITTQRLTIETENPSKAFNSGCGAGAPVIVIASMTTLKR